MWNKAVFVKDGVPADKIRVVGEGIDVATRFNPKRYSRGAARARFLKLHERGTFVFLFVGKFETRKGWEPLVRAFLEEFRENEKVTLLLRTSLGDNAWRWTESLKELCSEIDDFKCAEARANRQYRRHGRRRRNSRGRSIRLLPRVEPKQYPSMYRAADAFVLPSHGEGWGRPIMEAMAMELPVLATNWSGQTAYLNEWNAYPLPVDTFEPCDAEPQLQWASINITALRGLLRHVVRNSTERAVKGQRARSTVREQFDQPIVTQRVLSMLQRACREGHAKRLGTT